MKFILTKASSFAFKEEIEISSLEELKALQKKYERPYDPTLGVGWERPSLVVDFNYMEITIYDDYME